MAGGRKHRVLRPEEARLWHRIASSAKPIAGKNLKEIERLFVNEQAPAPKTAETPKSNPAPAKVVKRPAPTPIAEVGNVKMVRRGKLEIDAVLDLHGMNQDYAKDSIINFIVSGIANKYRTLLVITGKGGRDVTHEFDLLHAPRGVLRRRLKDWLHDASIRKYIAGVSEAHLKHGGSGAFYILLKSAHHFL